MKAGNQLSRTNLLRRFAWAPAAIAGVLLSVAACSGGQVSGNDDADEPTPGSSKSCSTTRQVFAEQIWPQIMAKKCINCHAPGGLAAERYASLLLYPTAYPGFLDQNLNVLRELAKTEYEDKSVLLRKPSGALRHGGGIQFDEDSAEYKLMADFVARLQKEETCNDAVVADTVQGVQVLSPTHTFRKASLILAGRIPTAAELDQLNADGEGALPGLLDTLMTESGFHDWLLVTFNDLFLTDRYLGDATNTLRREDFPNIDVYLADTVPEEEKRKYRRAVAREPLQLISYIVRNDRPFTEILTADYTVLNPYSAQIYNEYNVSFANPQDENEYQPGKIHALREGADLVYPHAGVLSSPMFLNRFPTSPTNRNRHRARILLDKFLATDILKIGERPIDPTQSVAFANPTREDPACSVCHSMIDPIAGAFMKFSDNDAEQLLPDRQWYNEMFLPGFGEEQMQVTDYPSSLPWVAARMAADPRFPLSVVYNTFFALTGQKPLSYPSDGDPGALKGWAAQDATFQAIAAKFVESGHNYKTVVRELILTPYFRAENVSADAAVQHQGELEAYGTARLSSPENLVRKLRATIGFDWVRYDRQPALTTTYDILYGGIDSDAVTERLKEPNGVMSSVMTRMANEVACQATAWDFLKPAQERLLFPNVETSDTPATQAQKIKDNIRYLHRHLLGEELAEDSPELTRTYTLLYDTWQEGFDKLTREQIGKDLPWNCRGRWNRLTGEELPEGERLEQDPNYTMRAWMAVLTYLLSDYRFLYE